MTIEKLGDAITELDSDILDRYFIMKQALIEEQNPKNHIWIKKMARKFGRMHMSTKETSVYQRRPSVAALIAAIVAIILTISVAATALIQWNDSLRDYLGISATDAEHLSEAVTMIGQSQTKDGIAVTVEQAFGDMHTAYIVAIVTFPEEIPLNCKTTIIPTLKNIDGSYNFDCVSINEEARTQTYIINIKSSNKKLIDKNIGLEFIGFRDDFNYTKYSSESWEFSFKLNYKDLSRSIPLDATVEDFRIKSAWISPASIIIYIENLPEELRKIEDFEIIMNDGSSPEILKYQIIGDIPSGDTTPIYGMFPQIIDPEEVKSIVVNGVEILID